LIARSVGSLTVRPKNKILDPASCVPRQHHGATAIVAAVHRGNNGNVLDDLDIQFSMCIPIAVM
jgi:hypothetical protein